MKLSSRPLEPLFGWRTTERSWRSGLYVGGEALVRVRGRNEGNTDTMEEEKGVLRRIQLYH